MTAQESARSLDRSMARAVAWNATARWASQILSWGSTIVVARLLTPYDYGLVGMASLYLNLAILISQAGIGDAIISLRDLTRRQIAELNTVSLLMGVSMFGLSWALALPLARFFSAPPLFAVIGVSSITYLINCFQVVPQALLQRELRFKLLASIEMIRASCQICATILFAWLKFGYWSLVIGYIIGCFIASTLTFFRKRHEFAIPNIGRLRRELRFTRRVLLSRVAGYAYDNADFGVAGRVLGEAALGNYTVAWTISSAPVEKVANLVTGVTPAYFSAVQTDKAQLRRYLLRLTEMLSFVTVPASIGLALVADYLVPVLLGPKWYGVIGPLRLLGFFVAARSVATILPNLLTAIGDTQFVMWAMIGAAIVMPVAFFIGSRWGTVGIAAAWVAAYPVIMVPMYYRVFQKTDMRPKEYFSVVAPAVSASIIMAIVVLLVRSTLPDRFHSLLGLSLLVLAGAGSYAGTLLAFYRHRVTVLIHAVRTMLGREHGGQPA
jgi:O-antigen/teichoic acid export membrane protein